MARTGATTNTGSSIAGKTAVGGEKGPGVNELRRATQRGQITGRNKAASSRFNPATLKSSTAAVKPWDHQGGFCYELGQQFKAASLACNPFDLFNRPSEPHAEAA